ncbi:MAG TPA: DNA topoisomerase IB [Thermoanaerobaculia bacterium]|nr:DNA topoisomerase IB [Thermoanaerobaculia bacterium]
MPARGVRRRWYLDLHGIRREGTKETGFTYRHPNGDAFADEKQLARISRLRIPPAWRDVRIARGESAPLQAVGVDKKGRTQYLYHTRFRAQREEEKFRHVVEFGEKLPALRRRVRADLKGDALSRERVLAAMVRLIDQGFFRIGNDKSADEESTYGLSTVHGRHVKIEGDTLRFDYIGKWKKQNQRAVRDPEVARIAEKLKKTKGAELFKFVKDSRIIDVKDRHVNDYIQSIIGPEFTAKDFRTWAGTLLCSIALAMQGQGTSKAERKRKIRQAITATSLQLGNTPAVCRKSYVCPRLLDEYMEGKPFETLRKTRGGSPVVRSGLSMEERALLRFLRETIADRRSRPRAA